MDGWPVLQKYVTEPCVALSFSKTVTTTITTSTLKTNFEQLLLDKDSQGSMAIRSWPDAHWTNG